MKSLHNDYLPWQRIMEIALGALGIAPEIFWQMTPTEWLAALKGWKRKYGMVDETPAITRNDLRKMIMQFPD